MGMYKYVRELWKQPRNSELWRARLIAWRKEPSTVRLEYPTRIDRARSLGYKAKPGIIVIRQRVLSGGRKRPDIKAGRRSKHNRQRKVLSMSYQQVAEQRVGRKHPNMEVLNSYWVAKDGKHYWYEVILVDTEHPVIKADEQLAWITSGKNSKRAQRGLTSAGKRSRGMLNKGKGAEKIRPSMRAHNRLAK